MTFTAEDPAPRKRKNRYTTRTEQVQRVRDQIANARELDLAKIGLNALIDEATGYQEKRPADALTKMLHDLEGTS